MTETIEQAAPSERAPDIDGPRITTPHLVVAALALGVVAVAVTAFLLRDNPMIDLRVYRSGAHSAALGQAFYDLRFDSQLPFTYPPFAALVFRPFAGMSIDQLRLLSILCSIVLLTVSNALAVRATGDRNRRRLVFVTLIATVVALRLEPIEQTLSLGQVNIFLMALVLVDLLALPERYRGVGIGIAAGLKLTPGIFIVYLACTRRWRAAMTASATFAATIAAAALVMPSGSKQYWLDHLFLDSDRVGYAGYVANQSLHGALVRLTDDHAGGIVALALVALVGAAGMAAAVVLHRNGREIEGILVCALSGLVISPISWSHHWVYVSPLVAVGLHRSLTTSSWKPTAAVAALVAVFFTWPFAGPSDTDYLPRGLIWLAADSDLHGYSRSATDLLWGNIELFAGLVLLAAAGVAAARLARRSSTAATGAVDTGHTGGHADARGVQAVREPDLPGWRDGAEVQP